MKETNFQKLKESDDSLQNKRAEMKDNNVKAILEAKVVLELLEFEFDTQAVPALLWENPVPQAVHTPVTEQAVQLVSIVEQARQVFPSVVLGKFEPEQAVQTPSLVQAVQLVIVEQSTQDVPKVGSGMSESEQVVHTGKSRHSVHLGIREVHE